MSMALLNTLGKKAGLLSSTPDLFPISIFAFQFTWAKLAYASLFFITFIVARNRIAVSGEALAWILCFMLIITGNLIQGGIHAAFVAPIDISPDQYYFDAARIGIDWRTWISNFNDTQSQLSTHGKTHPPFAILLHYAILVISGWNRAVLSLILAVISSMVVWISSLDDIEAAELQSRRNHIMLFLCCVPALNIYSIVTLDGVIATTSALCLWGLLDLSGSSPRQAGYIGIAAGILLTNLLTFAGTFLLATTAILAVKEAIFDSRFKIATAFLLSVALLVLMHSILLTGFGYDHLEAFATAARLENPQGFRGIHAPIHYVLTRVEDIAEFILFMGPAAAATISRPAYAQTSPWNWREPHVSIFLSASLVWLMMLIAGAYRTGETARACLFLYPFVFLMLRRASLDTIKALTVLGWCQTCVMQTMGYYVW